MLEQEIASIIKFTLYAAGQPAPYYYSVPQSFKVPSVFYPSPEIISGSDTFLTFYLDYLWFIKFFANTTEEAYRNAAKTLTAIEERRRLIPLINQEGETTGERLRINDPEVKILEDGAAQLYLSWRSRRPYADEIPLKMQSYHLYQHSKGNPPPDISEAMGNAISGYYLNE